MPQNSRFSASHTHSYTQLEYWHVINTVTFCYIYIQQLLSACMPIGLQGEIPSLHLYRQNPDISWLPIVIIIVELSKCNSVQRAFLLQRLIDHDNCFEIIIVITALYGTQYILLLGIHIYADQPHAHKVCIINLENEHIKLTCIDNYMKYNKQRGLIVVLTSELSS